MKKQKLKRIIQKRKHAPPGAKLVEKAPAIPRLSVKPKEKLRDMTITHIWTDGERTAMPYRPETSQVLIIGDGDFSFAHSLATNLGTGANLIATALDDEETLVRKYGKSGTNLENVNALRTLGATVLFGVDGTKLHLKGHAALRTALSLGKMSRIVFNFPHTGAGIKDRDRNIRAQQELLKAFLESSAKFLASQRSGVKLLKRRAARVPHYADIFSKSKSGGDTPSDDEPPWDNTARRKQEEAEIHVTLRTGDPYDDWNVKGLASATGRLVCRESFEFEPSKYPRYRHCRTIGDFYSANEEARESVEDGDFLKKPSKTFVFVLK